jgi:hypothetical protein
MIQGRITVTDYLEGRDPFDCRLLLALVRVRTIAGCRGTVSDGDNQLESLMNKITRRQWTIAGDASQMDT